jgi:tRNA pseudouridine55 synthase
LLNGILNINKPAGLTSHDVINKLRKILKMKKIGHAGTLDPMATGVLPVCTGKATRLIQYLSTDKQYKAEITLGISTDTYDAEGSIVSKTNPEVSIDEVKTALKKFQGEIIQQVPLYSATKHKGKELYKYARKGIEVDELPTKSVTIYNIGLTELSESANGNPLLKLTIDCSKGTYIRSIAHDLGQELGCGAHLSKLIRTLSSGLRLEDSITLEELEEKTINDQVNDILASPIDLINLPSLTIGYGQVERITKGQHFKPLKELFSEDQKLLLLTKTNQPVAICQYLKIEDKIQPITVLM